MESSDSERGQVADALGNATDLARPPPPERVNDVPPFLTATAAVRLGAPLAAEQSTP